MDPTQIRLSVTALSAIMIPTSAEAYFAGNHPALQLITAPSAGIQHNRVVEFSAVEPMQILLSAIARSPITAVGMEGGYYACRNQTRPLPIASSVIIQLLVLGIAAREAEYSAKTLSILLLQIASLLGTLRIGVAGLFAGGEAVQQSVVALSAIIRRP